MKHQTGSMLHVSGLNPQSTFSSHDHTTADVTDFGYSQYCSLNNLDLLGVVDSANALRLTWTQRIAAHFSLYPARVEAIATGTDPLLQDLLEYSFMKGLSLPRGE